VRKIHQNKTRILDILSQRPPVSERNCAMQYKVKII
jgi:hypothetical protein